MSYSGSTSPQIKLILEWTEGFKKRDLDVLTKPLHKDFRKIVYPRSLGKPEENREESIAHLAKVVSLWTENETTFHSVIEVPGKVITHITAKTKSKIGVDATFELITISHIVTDEDGSLKIKMMEEFFDSKSSIDTMKAYEAAGAGV